MIKKFVGGLVASMALASPAFAQEKTITEVEANYKQLAYEKLQDRLLTSQDVEELHSFLNNNLVKVTEQEVKKEPTLEQTSQLELDRIIEEYPGIINNTTNIVYNSELKLKPHQTEALKKFIENSEDQRIKRVLNSEFTVKDLVFVYQQFKPTSIRKDDPEKEAKKNILNRHMALYESYLKEFKDVQGSYFNGKKYFSIGVLGGVELSSRKTEFIAEEEQVKKALKEYTLINDLSVPSIEQHFPNYPKFSYWYFLTWILSGLAPIPVRILGKIYRKDKEFTENDGLYHTIDGLCMSALGLEVLHPSIFYIRLAAPLVHEVLKGWDVLPE